jgi:sugar phosphate isomerase/epimerase
MIRRRFIKNTTVLSAGALLTMRCKADKLSSHTGKAPKYGLQLYTVRDDMTKDPKATLTALAEIGYADLECAGYDEGKFYGMPREEFKKVIDDLGLTILSGHIATGQQTPDKTGTLINGWEKACEDAVFMGQKSIVCPNLTEEERSSIDKYKELADLFNKCGATAKEYGLTFAYHNHAFEFEELEGQLPYDVLLERMDESVANFELDLYWITKAGYDPHAYFDNHPGRFPLWHVKDMEDSEDRFFTEVGNGVIDWIKIFNKIEVSGMKNFYVEQDVCRNHKPLESVKISHNYLSSIKV